jgi:hypothetical protein
MESLIILLIYVTSAYYSYTMAEERGRSAIGYALSSLFFTWLIPLFLFIVGRTDAKVMEMTLEAIDRNTD